MIVAPRLLARDGAVSIFSPMTPASFFSIAFGAGAALYAGFQIVRALLSTRWPSVSGKIAMTRLCTMRWQT